MSTNSEDEPEPAALQSRTEDQVIAWWCKKVEERENHAPVNSRLDLTMDEAHELRRTLEWKYRKPNPAPSAPTAKTSPRR